MKNDGRGVSGSVLPASCRRRLVWAEAQKGIMMVVTIDQGVACVGNKGALESMLDVDRLTRMTKTGVCRL